jgi:hypothetical protein
MVLFTNITSMIGDFRSVHALSLDLEKLEARWKTWDELTCDHKLAWRLKNLDLCLGVEVTKIGTHGMILLVHACYRLEEVRWRQNFDTWDGYFRCALVWLGWCRRRVIVAAEFSFAQKYSCSLFHVLLEFRNCFFFEEEVGWLGGIPSETHFDS